MVRIHQSPAPTELMDSYVAASGWVSVLKERPTLLTFAYERTKLYLGKSYTTEITCYTPYSRQSPPRLPTVIPSDHGPTIDQFQIICLTWLMVIV